MTRRTGLCAGVNERCPSYPRSGLPAARPRLSIWRRAARSALDAAHDRRWRDHRRRAWNLGRSRWICPADQSGPREHPAAPSLQRRQGRAKLQKSADRVAVAIKLIEECDFRDTERPFPRRGRRKAGPSNAAFDDAGYGEPPPCSRSATMSKGGMLQLVRLSQAGRPLCHLMISASPSRVPTTAPARKPRSCERGVSRATVHLPPGAAQRRPLPTMLLRRHIDEVRDGAHGTMGP
jgi:hypothetical protein